MEKVVHSASELKVRGFDELLPILIGRVFHVTTESAFENILATGFIQPNITGNSSPFGNSDNGYFRNRNCISFFDYRNYGSPEWEAHANKCLPTLPFVDQKAIVVLFLSQTEYSKLLPWSGWKAERAWSQRVVPHVETGYPGPLSLTAITSIVKVVLRHR
jgi:hypothetical protein